MLKTITSGFCITNGVLEYTVHYIEKNQVYYCCIDKTDNFNLYRVTIKKFIKMIDDGIKKQDVVCFTKLGFNPLSTLDLITKDYKLC